MKIEEGGIRAAFLTVGIEEAAVAYLADCRQVLMASDPSVSELTQGQIVQAMISMAMQRMMHWSALHRGEADDADEIPSQALIGAFTGIGIALAMLNYDPQKVLGECVPAMGRAYADAMEMIDAEGSASAATVN